MIKLLDNIQKNLFYWIMGTIIAGLLVVQIFGGYKFTPIICIVAALVMIYPSFVPLAFNKLPSAMKNYKVIIISIVINFVVFPFLAFYVGEVFLIDEPVFRIGLMLLALLPGGGMVTTWAMKSKADMSVTVSVIITNLLVAIVAVPFGLSFFMQHFGLDKSQNVENPISGQEICTVEKTTKGIASCDFGGEGVTPGKIAVPIFVIVVIPLLAAYATQRVIVKRRGRKYFDRVKDNFSNFSNLGLVIVLFALMSLENNKVIFENPKIIIDIFIPLFIFYLLGLMSTLAVYRIFVNKKVGKAFVWGSYLRYITLALGIATSLVFQDESLSVITTVIVLAYFIQIPSSFMLVKFLQKSIKN
jgi:ACR3 family arsenite efflux pump ArsB